ncbi:MAG: hypothetical protein JNM57_13260 [Cyclobacteriaceae bacterium]|nr:hypothetical protein [Cyclobacteriaceae bacterium]
MKGLSKIEANGKEILFVDYSNKKEAEMIPLILESKKIIQSNRAGQLLLSDFTNTYASPAFMNVLRREIMDVLPLISKQAIIGLNEPKRWILKGFNLLLKTDYRAFDTKEEALAYLSADEATTV